MIRNPVLPAFVLVIGGLLAVAQQTPAQTTDGIGGNVVPPPRPRLVINGPGSESARIHGTAATKVEITASSVTGTPKTLDPSAGSAGKGLDTIRTAGMDPTSIYRIGIDDILAIEIASVPAPAKSVKVRTDGTIDFPLAGGDIVVAGKTPREAASAIAGLVKLVAQPRVTVRIREYGSHSVNVWGLVEQPGEQQIQRDAVPFYVIRAGLTADPRAKKVRITRSASGNLYEYALSDPRLGDMLIYPGDSIEFGS